MSQWARAQRRVFHANLWMLRIPVAGPPSSPNSVAWWEQGLQALAGAGLDAGEEMSVILLVSGFVRNEALLMGDLRAVVESRGASVEEVVEGYARTVNRLVDPVRHPALSRLMAAQGMRVPDRPDHEFTFGLERVLDGVGVLIGSRA